MNDSEKLLLAQKLTLTEGRGRSDKIKDLLSTVKTSQQELSCDLINAEADVDAMLAEMGINPASVSVDAEEYLFSTLPFPDSASFHEMQPLVRYTDIGVEEYLGNNGIDPSKDILTQFFTQYELSELLSIKETVEEEFSNRTSLVNKLDLTFLTIATAIQTAKALIFPYVSEKTNYGDSFNPEERLQHDDKSIKDTQKKANDDFKEKYIEKKGKTGYWIQILYQTVPFDTTVGSPAIGYNMQGKYHRIHTLGHDPILGWIFGTANILTDTMTLANFSTYRVERKPKIRITPEIISPSVLIEESYEMMRADPLNLPAALFAEYQHLKSDHFTKLGLPVPILQTFSPELAGQLYKENYDALCLARDAKLITGSAVISAMCNMIIALIHGLFYDPNKEESRELYEIRTRKILLISNMIASSSNIINAYITANPKNLDLGGLLVTITRLFSDARFITKVKKDFIESEQMNLLEEKLQLLGY